MNIIKADSFVSELKCPAFDMLKSIVEEFNGTDDVLLFETHHGHIAELSKKAGSFIPGREGQAGRLDAEQLAFLGQLKGVRWVEMMHDKLRIGL